MQAQTQQWLLLLRTQPHLPERSAESFGLLLELQLRALRKKGKEGSRDVKRISAAQKILLELKLFSSNWFFHRAVWEHDAALRLVVGSLGASGRGVGEESWRADDVKESRPVGRTRRRGWVMGYRELGDAGVFRMPDVARMEERKSGVRWRRSEAALLSTRDGVEGYVRGGHWTKIRRAQCITRA